MIKKAIRGALGGFLLLMMLALAGVARADVEFEIGTATTATVAGTVTVADTTDTTAFCALLESATGDLAVKTDAGCAYNAGTGTLAVTALTGSLAGATGLPISTGVSGLGANVATALATPSSANIAAAITNESGTGFVVFSSGGELAGNKAIDGAGTLTGAAHHCFEMFPTVYGGDIVASSAALYSVYVDRAFTFTSAVAYATTTGTTDTIKIDIKENGVSTLSTLLTLDPSENSSRTATPAVISDSAIAEGASLQAFVNKADTGNTGAGLEMVACGHYQ